ncbi:MAG: twin-arginine translocase TatA/TatE family subunit [Elusimicrobiota bacterium]|jgi:sec-independent protein translocase protein TatA|nr:twin-arginine translocase TatA/TatE family subunit [Elusimicrobiota bacterium]
MSLGFTEIILILIVILLLFGAKRIPEIAKAIGRASYEYKKAKAALKKESEELMETIEKSGEDSANKDTDTRDTEKK